MTTTIILLSAINIVIITMLICQWIESTIYERNEKLKSVNKHIDDIHEEVKLIKEGIEKLSNTYYPKQQRFGLDKFSN